VDNPRAFGNYYETSVTVDSADIEDRLEDNLEYSDTLQQVFKVDPLVNEYDTGDVVGS
jgi:hypothetical protein